MKYIKHFEEYVQDIINNILDKSNEFGYDSLSDDEKNHILFQYASIKQRIDELQLQLNQIQDSIGISDFSFNHDYTDIYIIVMTSEPIITTWKPITLKYVEEN